MDKEIVTFIFELGQLRRIEHEGWRLAGVDHIESVAEHSLRAAQIGFILAKMEGYENPHEIVTRVVFHDMGECRVGDIHKVANRYIEVDEEQAVKDQTSKLGVIGEEILAMWKEVEERLTSSGNIAKDADYLEQAILAKEYLEKGVDYASDWIKNVGDRLQTTSAKKLFAAMQELDSNDWWQELKKH